LIRKRLGGAVSAGAPQRVQLSKTLAVRTPVRAALQRRRRGLLDYAPNRGFTVLKFHRPLDAYGSAPHRRVAAALRRSVGSAAEGTLMASLAAGQTAERHSN
jgi:hypothetical protein